MKNQKLVLIMKIERIFASRAINNCAERRHDVPVDGVVVEDEDLNVPVHGVGDHGEAPVRTVSLLLPANPLQQVTY
jgi:hypothetical protein